MVCPRCIEAVKNIFEKVGLSIVDIQLGKVNTKNKISSEQRQLLKEQLSEQGFQLLDDKHAQLINKIKSIIIQEVHYQDAPLPVNFSTLLSEQLHFDYTYLSRLFSSVEGQTIERFILAQKVERVKELLTYDEMTIIAALHIFRPSSKR